MDKRRTLNIHDDRGASMLEYALVVTLIALMGTASMSALETGLSEPMDTVAAALAGRIGPSDQLCGNDALPNLACSENPEIE